DVASKSLDSLLAIWIDKKSRQELRDDLREHDIYPSAFRHYLNLQNTDDVDILAKVGFDLVRVPTRHQRVVRFWDEDEVWLNAILDGSPAPRKILSFPPPVEAESQILDAEDWGNQKVLPRFKRDFWHVALDHYALFGIDDLESARTYGAPQFVD